MSLSEPNRLDAATLGWIDHFAPYGVIATDQDLRVQRWNQWMTIHSGHAAADAIGRRITEIFPELIARRLEGHFDRALRGEVSVLSTALHGYLFPLAPVGRDTDFQWMRQTARIAPLGPADAIQGVIVVIEDVTQREWQSEVLRKQHARDEILSWALAHLLKADDPRRVSRDLFCKVAAHLDFDAYLLYLSEIENSSFRLSAAGGLTPEAEESIHILPAVKIPWISSAQEALPLIREYTEIQNDPTFETGKTLGFHAYIVLPLISGSKLLGFLTFATRSRRSIARGEAELLGTIAQYLAVALNREKTDRELREAQRKLNDHAQELEGKVAERTASLKQIIAELQTFSYTVAHDLRAPIRALKGYCEVLLEDFSAVLPDEATAVVGKLHDASVRMDSLTRDLLEFSKISRQDIQLSSVNLEAIISDVLFAFGPAAISAVTIVGPLPRVLAQDTLVRQCVSNLIENAMKFVPAGRGPKITVSSEIVSATALDDANDSASFTRSRYFLEEQTESVESKRRRIRVWFKDEGIGIPAEAKHKIFGIFERGVDSVQFEGTGIGLAIVARAMERMGGNCGVESEPGAGSRFWLEFRLPAKPLSTSPRPVSAHA
jgi:signal transduction histidine kinase